jgi:Raf kinase inhibitor-like YbhB/YbcL family protein
MDFRCASVCVPLLVIVAACTDDGSADGTSSSSTSSATTGGNSSSDATASATTATATTGGSSSDGSGSSSTGAADTTSADSTGDESSSTTEPVAFTLTSPSFVEGGGIPGMHHVSGGNVSPQLDWVGAPADTVAFAVFFHDITIDFEHSAIWNIPADATGLPEGVDEDAMPANVPGATQCRSWAGNFGYGGPGSADNFYEFTLYAIDVATLDEIDENSTLVEVRAALGAHALGTATLTGQSTGPNGPD